MKILKLKLKNFASIYNAMEAKEITIDFTQSKNKICLLIGKNGSGKTSILSMLTPFSDLGNLDVRNNQSLILKDKEGYKEIHIEKNGSIYIIKHIYSPHKDKSHSLKSYIEKDGVELNINGNVRSFLEVVKNELYIEPEYLKLIRLGSNVTNIIGLSETERKNFMSKIMSNIDVFIDYYKIVNTKERQIKDNISHIADKLSRLGISDITIANKDIDDTRLSIEKLSGIKEKISSEIAILNHDIDNIDDVENLRDNLNKTSKSVIKMKETLLKYKPDKLSSDHYKTEIDNEESEIRAINNKIATFNTILLNEITNLDSLYEQYNLVRAQYDKELDNDSTIKSMEDNLTAIRLSLRESEDILGEFKPSISYDDYVEFMSFVNELTLHLNTTYDFGSKAINKVLKLMEEGKDVNHYINSHLIDMDDNKSDVSSLFIAKVASDFLFNDRTVITCKTECEAKRVYDALKKLIEDHNVSEKNNDVSFYKDMERVNSNIINIFKMIDERSILINGLPDDIKIMFKKENLISKIKKLENPFDEKILNNYLSLITEYNRYVGNCDKYEKEEELIRKFRGTSNLTDISNQKESLENIIKDKDDKIKEIKENISKDTEILSELTRSYETNKDIYEALTEYDEMVKANNKYISDYELYKTNKEKIHDLTVNLNGVTTEYNNKNDLLHKMILNVNQYNLYMKELESFNKIYDEMDKVKESLSAKTGMPLYIIRKYLGDDTVISTNDLLDVAYNGDIELDDFEITPSSFTIPVYVRGFRMPDVKYVSQGELSFISIALSFALSSIVLSKYNIMLLDEIDGPLDSDNREKFIKILEKQIEKIDSEQNFLITHNSMFSSYPVDIIDLSFKNDTSSYPMANFINIERE